MLHIILVILKAVGILLAAVLLLLLLALLLLLFVPLRYEVAFRHTEEDTFVRGKVSWLLHLVTARIFYEKPDGKRAVGENRRLSADSEEGEGAEAREKDIA